MSRYSIAPDQDRIGFWNVYEGWWIFKNRWNTQVDSGYYGGVYKPIRYHNLQEAKAAIDREIEIQKRRAIEQPIEDEKLRNWRNIPWTDYP